MVIKAALFDIDGTLTAHTPYYIHKVVKSVFNEFGVELSPEERLWFWYSYDREKFLRERNIQTPAFWNTFRRYLSLTSEERRRNTYAYEDCAALQTIKDAGVGLGVVTNSSMSSLPRKLALVGVDFDAVVCAYNLDNQKSMQPKPHPEIIYECMRILNSTATETCITGNGDEDIIAGRSAGIYTIGIDRGEYPLKEKPDALISTLFELPELLRKF